MSSAPAGRPIAQGLAPLDSWAAHPVALIADQINPRVLPQRGGLAAAAQAALDPCIAVGVLLACAFAFGDAVDSSYLILAFVASLLTYPGTSPARMRLPALAIDVLGRWIMSIILLVFLGWATRTIDAFDSRVLLAWALATPGAMMAAHWFLRVVRPYLLAVRGAQRTAVILGRGELGQALAARVREAPDLGIRIAGYFDDRGPERSGGVAQDDELGTLVQLPEYVKTHHIDLIYITLPMASRPRLFDLLGALNDTTASIYFVPDIFLVDLIQARMDMIGGMPLIAVCDTPFHGINRVVKDVSDIVLASLILALIAPLMLAIAVGIKLSSPGPVLFRQRRYGVDGKEITVYKFRSMNVLEDGAVIRQATRGDKRVTPFGALLRRTSLDELPQFINVLQGRMSVVGPRPHAVAHTEMYRKLIKGYMIRHKVKPGITGLAQVSGLRGETETVDKMRARIECDLVYLRNWSLRLDLQIVFKTIPVILQNRVAY